MPPGMGQLESLLPSSTSSSACMCVRMGTRCSQASFPCVPELQHEAPADQVMVQLHNSCAVYGAGQRVSACMLTNLWGNRHPTVQSPAVNLPADVLAQYLEHIDNDLPQVFPDLPDMLRHTAPDVLQQAAQEPPVVHLPCPCSQYEAPGADLHQQLCKTQKHADLGERAVTLMLNAIATCHHGGSSVCSSTEDMAMPCLFKTSEQLDAGECSWGLQLTKQRSAPAGQKRTRNGTSIPRNFNFCSNAPVQLQNQGLMWELLQAQDSRRGAALLGEEGRGTDAPSCQLFSIRSCTQGLTAYALACHDSNSCEACLLAGQGAQCEILGSVGTCGSTTSPGEEPPAASHSPLDHLLWCSSRIKCRKQRNRWQGHHFFLFKFVFVSIDRAKAAVCSAAHTKAKKGP